MESGYREANTVLNIYVLSDILDPKLTKSSNYKLCLGRSPSAASYSSVTSTTLWSLMNSNHIVSALATVRG